MNPAMHQARGMQPTSHIVRGLGFGLFHQLSGTDQAAELRHAPVGACWHILQTIRAGGAEGRLMAFAATVSHKHCTVYALDSV